MTMLENKIYVGIDVSKEHLDIHVPKDNHFINVANSKEGIRQLKTKLKKYQKNQIHIGMESTGGYEKLVKIELLKSNYAVSVLNPRFIRHFAKASNKLAKTDKIDAKIIASYCEKMEPPVNAKIDKKQEEIAELVARRDQLISLIVAEKNRLYHASSNARKSIKAVIEFLKKQLKVIEIELEKLMSKNEKFTEKRNILTSIKGIGRVTANALIVHLPELGQLDEKQISALAGLAPFNCDSGKMKGKRIIWGGRRSVRIALYMATMAAVRSNKAIKEFYSRLVQKGKAKMVALTACMRKLIVILNAMIRKNEPWQENYAR